MYNIMSYTLSFFQVPQLQPSHFLKYGCDFMTNKIFQLIGHLQPTFKKLS